MTTAQRAKVVIIGAGFGGLFAAKQLANCDVDVLLIDRNNFHTFTPLLYQVATSGLEPGDISYPVRGIFRNKRNIRFLMGEVEAIDADEKAVVVRTNGTMRRETYDYLVVAAGSVTNTFGNAQIAQFGFGLKELHEAVALRNHILRLFERAAWTDDPAYREALTTLVVVGGGPTGLEIAGALYELHEHVLRKEYEHIDNMRARVILVEAVDRLLAPFPEGLQQAALEQLESLGVEVVLSDAVDEVTENQVRLKSGRVIPTHTLVWSAGVQASPLAQMLGVELARMGRIPVKATLEISGRDAIYVVGDMAYLEDGQGKPYPMLIPVAQQQGKLAAQNILRRIAGQPGATFVYRDRGIMTTIGRSRAVAYLFNRIPLRGYLAWVSWLGLHLIELMGFRNRVSVMLNWIWNYLLYPLPDAHSARMIVAVGESRRAEARRVSTQSP